MKKLSAYWGHLFLFCIGLLIVAAFAMKWMEGDLVHDGEKVSVFGLELFYPKENIVEIFSGMSDNHSWLSSEF